VGCGTEEAGRDGGGCDASGATPPHAAMLADAKIAMAARVQIRTCRVTRAPFALTADDQTVAEFSYTM
jgi:hypothetical protein